VLVVVFVALKINHRITLTNDVDKDGYLRPQPSVGYVESHQVIPVSSPTPAITNDNTYLSSEEYCYVTPPPVQVPQLPTTCGHVGIQDSDGYLVPHCTEDAHFYKC